MRRRIIEIDKEKCNGCGICINACHEGALELINGKAVLLKEDFCDGLGDCLPNCPQGAISFIEKDTLEYNIEAVNKAKKDEDCNHECPSNKSYKLNHKNYDCNVKQESCLLQWPCQIKLAPLNAPYYENAKLLIAADCTAYAYANIHNDFMKDKITLIGCPKLDSIDYSAKLCEILRLNNIKSVTILKMEVPCCNGLANAVKAALTNCGKLIPWSIYTISINGNILE